jgi:hypothetical protein
MRRVAVMMMAMAVMLVGLAVPAGASSTRQTADVIENQSGGGEILQENAHLTRTGDGLSIRIKMETPTPGTYNYPDSVPADRQVGPEIFTGWAFVFANPDECSVPCNGDDFGNPDVGAGVYNFAGHVKGTGGYMTLSGHIQVGQTAGLGAPGGNVPFALTNPMGAEVHVAVAPHGQVDSGTLPGELRTPVGSPFCDCWWVSVFLPPA